MRVFRGPIVALGQRFASAADTIRRGLHEPSVSTRAHKALVKLLTPRGGPRHRAVVGVGSNARRRVVRCAYADAKIPNLTVCADEPTACPQFNIGQRTALCAGRDTHSQHRAKQWGREQPPRFLPYATPGGSREGCSRPGVSVPIARGILQRSARRLRVRYRARTRRRSLARCAALSAMVRAGLGHHMIRIEQCSASPRLSLRSTPAGFGLHDACAQLESSTCVMAEEARPSFPR